MWQLVSIHVNDCVRIISLVLGRSKSFTLDAVVPPPLPVLTLDLECVLTIVVATFIFYLNSCTAVYYYFFDQTLKHIYFIVQL